MKVIAATGLIVVALAAFLWWQLRSSGATNSTLVALDVHNGLERWRARPPSTVLGTPSLVNGVLAVDGTSDPNGSCSFVSTTLTFDPGTGSQLGNAQFAAYSERFVTDRGTAYALGAVPPPATGPDTTGRPTYQLIATDIATGGVRWRRSVAEGFFDHPRLAAGDGIIAAMQIQSGIGNAVHFEVDAFDEADGTELWHQDVDPFPDSVTPSLTFGAHAYVEQEGGTLAALDPHTGEVLWTIQAPAASIAAGTGIVATTNSSKIAAFDEDGHALWSVSVPGSIEGRPRLEVGGDTIFVAGAGRYGHSCSD